LTRIDAAEPEDVWASDDVLSSQYNTPICHLGHLYGIHGREDVGVAELRCVEARTGEVKWKVADFGVAHLILADHRLLVLKVDGTLLLVEPDARRFTKLAEAQVSSHTTRALPALSAGRFYFRDNSGEQGALVCLQVGR